MTCTATLDTVTVNPCEHHDARLDCRPDVYGGAMVHIEVHTLRCEAEDTRRWNKTLQCLAGWHETEEGEVWHDDSPGATRHVGPLATDDEVQAIALAWFDLRGRTLSESVARRLAEAAAEARTP